MLRGLFATVRTRAGDDATHDESRNTSHGGIAVGTGRRKTGGPDRRVAREGQGEEGGVSSVITAWCATNVSPG